MILTGYSTEIGAAMRMNLNRPAYPQFNNRPPGVPRCSKPINRLIVRRFFYYLDIEGIKRWQTT